VKYNIYTNIKRNEQSSLNIKKPTKFNLGNTGSGLGQAQNSGRFRFFNEIITLTS
jgi:hypothetical protein